MTLRFLTGQLRYLGNRGFDVHVVSSPGADLHSFAEAEGVTAHAIAMARSITPAADLIALYRLWRLFRALRPEIVHAHTPKGGLLGAIAAWLARVPARIYHVHGLPLVTSQGPRRIILRTAERVSCRLATQVLCVSRSVRDVVVKAGLCPADKIDVLCGGTINGVDATGRFQPQPDDVRLQVRRKNRIPREAIVLGYVGRIVRDKGWSELAEAWRSLRESHPDLHLLVVGDFEPQDPVPPEVVELIRTDPRIHHAGFDWDTPPLYAAMDLVVLPTHREGFPVVPLEAAAMGLPVVATRVPGCVDAVEDGVTGKLVQPRDPVSLAWALAAYLSDATLRRAHGAAGRRRVLREFRPQAIWEATAGVYRKLRATAGGPQHGLPLFAKTLGDRMVALAGLVLVAPALAAVALTIRARFGSPVLFVQERPGRFGRPFRLVKFRTMRDAEGPDGQPLPDDQRLTALGRFLRATSLDELPQLWNVLRGELSLVGPRPLLMRYLPRYSPEQARRHEVLPGITGWAQVNGRNAISWDQKFALDVWYVDHWSLMLDLRILLMTLWRVLRREGITRDGHATTPEFMGAPGAGDEEVR
jgi:lipopolysaccharide/colanic/teichoic acid biosynthesis glycosyltransferase/glycosyltransferase involved in cell wall biosynthesis